MCLCQKRWRLCSQFILHVQYTPYIYRYICPWFSMVLVFSLHCFLWLSNDKFMTYISCSYYHLNERSLKRRCWIHRKFIPAFLKCKMQQISLIVHCCICKKRRKHSIITLVVECWLRVREVPGSIPSQGPRHTKDVIKWYQ